MRGVKLFACLAVSILFLTGCGGEKTLTCTNSEEQNGINIDQKITMTFKDDKVTDVKMSIDSKASSDLIENNWDTFASMMDQQFEEKDENGVSLKINNDASNHTYRVELTVDLEKATDDALSEYGLDGITDANASYEDTKKDAEDAGYTCK